MTEPIDLVKSTPGARIDALARRGSRQRPAGRAGGPSFESLLAQASSRLVTELPSEPLGIGQTGPLARPTGALGTGSIVAGSPIAGLGGLGDRGAITSQLGLTGGLPSGSPAGAAVVEAATEHLGVPYLWGGTDPEHGFDCSGLVQDAYRAIGVEMPKWSRHQATMGVEVESIDQALPGDVLAFGEPVNHVALYVGDGQMLHAPKTGEVVKIEPIDRPIATIRRIVSPVATQLGSIPTAGLGAVAGSTSAADFGPVGSAGGPTFAPGEAERRYQPLFEAAGARWDVDPALLAAVAETESAFNPNAVSPVGARGLMQFMPATAAEMGVDPLDPASAIDGAARYLRTSLDQFATTELAIASYNAGRGAVSRYGGIPPYRETENYVEKVLDAWRSRS